jgi:hypothetical protein
MNRQRRIKHKKIIIIIIIMKEKILIILLLLLAVPIPLAAARSKEWVCGRSLVGIVGSNPSGGMVVSLVSVVCCQVEVSASG